MSNTENHRLTVTVTDHFDEWERTTTFVLAGPTLLQPGERSAAGEAIKAALNLEAVGYSIEDFYQEYRKVKPPPLDN